VEIAWSEIDFDLSATLFGDEPMSSFVARLGVYTTPSEHDSTRSRVVVPLFQLRAQPWSPRSLISIGEYEHAGARLESGFRRVLHLRLALGADCWTKIGLSCLDELSVPFPSLPLQHSYPFPKISGAAAANTGDSVGDFMDRVHAGRADVPRQVFPPSCLPELCQHLLIGQYYQPLPLSKSADALIRCQDHVVCQFQFKNVHDPLSESQLRDEAVKCQLGSGWQSVLVVVAPAGHSIADGATTRIPFEFEHGSVDVIALSKQAVVHFLGARASEAIQPQASLLASSLHHLTLSSPVKLASRVAMSTQLAANRVVFSSRTISAADAHQHAVPATASAAAVSACAQMGIDLDHPFAPSHVSSDSLER
jgi:hypothetical protein